MIKEIKNKLKNISLATGYIASYVSDNPSLKDSVRRLSVDILNESKNLKDISQITNILDSALDLIDLGLIDGSISDMNARIYSQGILLFIDNLPVSLDMIAQSGGIEIESRKIEEFKVKERLEELLMGGDKGIKNLGLEVSTRVMARESLKKVLENKADIIAPKIVRNTSEMEAEDIPKEVSLNVPKEGGKVSSLLDSNYIFQTLEESDRKQRRTAILSVLAVGGNSVNDIKYKFPKYSEKTLQRDINEMIEEKKIVRIGEKRWAKYYIK